MSALQITANIAFLAFPFGIIGLVILWERKALQPFDDAFDQLTQHEDVRLLNVLRGVEGTGCEQGFRHSGTKE